MTQYEIERVALPIRACTRLVRHDAYIEGPVTLTTHLYDLTIVRRRPRTQPATLCVCSCNAMLDSLTLYYSTKPKERLQWPVMTPGVTAVRLIQCYPPGVPQATGALRL